MTSLALEIPRDPITLGNILAASGYFQDSQEGAQAAVKIMAGQEMGIPPIAAMTGLNVIKGKVTLSANLMATCVKKHPKYDYRVTTHTDQECVIEFYQDGELAGQADFSMAKAQRAGLANQDNYKKHPENMLFARAMSNGAKWYCPDAFGGSPVYTPDELGGHVDGETLEVIDAPHGYAKGGLVTPPAEITVGVPGPPVGLEDENKPVLPATELPVITQRQIDNLLKLSQEHGLNEHALANVLLEAAGQPRREEFRDVEAWLSNALARFPQHALEDARARVRGWAAIT